VCLLVQLVCDAAGMIQAQLGVQVMQLGGAAEQEGTHHRLCVRPRLPVQGTGLFRVWPRVCTGLSCQALSGEIWWMGELKYDLTFQRPRSARQGRGNPPARLSGVECRTLVLVPGEGSQWGKNLHHFTSWITESCVFLESLESQ